MTDKLNVNGKRGIEEDSIESGSADADESADVGVTMLDVLQDEHDLEEDANVSLSF